MSIAYRFRGLSATAARWPISAVWLREMGNSLSYDTVRFSVVKYREKRKKKYKFQLIAYMQIDLRHFSDQLILILTIFSIQSSQLTCKTRAFPGEDVCGIVIPRDVRGENENDETREDGAQHEERVDQQEQAQLKQDFRITIARKRSKDSKMLKRNDS